MQQGKTGRDVVSIHAIKRMPLYYNYIKQLGAQGIANVSAPAIARHIGLNEVQVRKDLAMVSCTGGRPKTGFGTAELLECIGKFLGYDSPSDAILVGAGNLGMALFSYGGFEEYGLRIVAAFDNDASKIGKTAFDKTVFSTAELGGFCARHKTKIGIICVPAGQAQKVCDLLVESGVLAVWNFAPTHLVVPDHILVQTENMAASLSLLSRHLSASMAES